MQRVEHHVPEALVACQQPGLPFIRPGLVPRNAHGDNTEISGERGELHALPNPGSPRQPEFVGWRALLDNDRTSDFELGAELVGPRDAIDAEREVARRVRPGRVLGGGAFWGKEDWISLHETHFSNRIRPIGADRERAKTSRGRPISSRRAR